MKKSSVFLVSLLFGALLAFAQDGSLDNSFATGGFATTQLGGSSQATAMTRQTDGKIVAAGIVAMGGAQLAVVRYKTDGSLDNTFGTGGKISHLLSAEPLITSLGVQPDGKIVVAGGLQDGTGQRAFIARLSATGQLDNTFGTNGVAEFQDGFTRVNDFEILSTGKIVGLGTATNSGASVIGLFRRNANGAKDTGWGTNGYVYAEVADQELGQKMTLQADGKIVVTGSALTPNTTSNTSLLLVRFKTDGTLDNTFGTGGKVLSAFSNVQNSKDLGYDVAVQADGKIVVAGRNNPNSKSSFLVARYSSAGVLDNSFGTNGRTITTVTSGVNNEALSLSIQGSGKILLGGYVGASFSTRKVAVVRYGANGQIDNTFGTSGIATPTIGGNASAERILLQPDGKILAGGWTLNAGSYSFIVARLNNSGTSGLPVLEADALAASVFPNPARESATLNFTLESAGETTVRLLSLDGRVTAVFFREKLAAGPHSRHLQLPASVTSGFYFVQIETERGVANMPFSIL